MAVWDFEDELLAEMDIVIASVHSGFKQGPEDNYAQGPQCSSE